MIEVVGGTVAAVLGEDGKVVGIVEDVVDCFLEEDILAGEVVGVFVGYCPGEDIQAGKAFDLDCSVQLDSDSESVHLETVGIVVEELEGSGLPG
jgi:hypothetical protein